MSGLKRVEDQKYEMKKLSSTTNLDPCQTGGKETSEETLGCKNLDRNGKGSIKRERNSSDTKVRKKDFFSSKMEYFFKIE